MKRFTKTIFKEFRRGLGRFIAIFAIIALGVGFVFGLMQTTPNMKNTMDDYYRDNAMYDIDIKGTMGLTASDVEEIENLTDGGETLAQDTMSYIQTDVSVMDGDEKFVARINGITDFNEDGSAATNLNLLTVEEGRFPQSADECVVERTNNNFKDIAVGDTITIPDPDGGTYGDVYDVEEFTVVGIVSDPAYYYLSAREVTTIGSGVVGTVMYVDRTAYSLSYEDDDDTLGHLSGGAEMSMSVGPMTITTNLFDAVSDYFNVDVAYTDCVLTLKESQDYSIFDDEYEDCLEASAELYEDLADSENISIATIDESLEKYGSMLGDYADSFSASWYVLDIVNSNVSYIGFSMNVDKVAAITTVFPVFFIIVAALVAITSMSRMVEEDRATIGTLKGLGYSNSKITSKYMIYCLTASMLGGIVGLVLGFGILPSIIWMAYGTLYYLPSMKMGVDILFIVITVIVLLAMTVAVTLYSSWSALKERPSELMQAKAPKKGKRILLERVGFLWNPLPFKYKATIRNIFRYKKNMILTIISVMGCTALIVAGFSVSDSVGVVSDVQYVELVRYDMEVKYSSDSYEDVEALSGLLEASEAYEDLYSENMTLKFTVKDESEQESVEAIVVDPAGSLSDVVTVRNRKTEIEVDFTETGVAVPENIAVEYDLDAGDTITVRSADGDEADTQIIEIFENYVGTRVYLSEDTYETLFGEEVENNLLFITVDTDAFVSSMDDLEDRDDISSMLLDDSDISSVSYTEDDAQVYSSLMGVINYVIILLVVCAGALAAIVLYNLTNINIDERQREIATLKVLGYTKAEVAGYVYRESGILTVVGALLGLLLGWLVHDFFILPCIDGISLLMGRAVYFWSYLYGFGLTIIFAALVYAFMLIKLNRINPAEALKSME